MNQRAILLFLCLITLDTVFAVQTGSPCETTEDCPRLHECLPDKGNLVCVHKELFPITAVEVIGTFVILIMNSLLTAGGIGGGAAYVPYIMIFFSVTLPQAVAFGFTCVFGGGVGNLMNIIRLRNPKTKRFMINYDVNLIILPALMVGVMIGMILNRIFPPLVTNIILLFVLAYSLSKNVKKAKLNLAKEKKERAQKKINSTQGAELVKTSPESDKIITGHQDHAKEVAEEAAILNENNTHNNEETEKQQDEVVQSGNENQTNREDQSQKSLEVKANHDLEKRHLLEKREQKFPFHKLLELLLNVVVIIVVGIIRGTKNFDPVVGVDWTCGWDFLWFAIGILLFGLLSCRNVYKVHQWQKEKIAVGYEFLPEEPILHPKRIIKLLIVSVCAGIIGAIIALGGALVISPTLLEMGIPPSFSALTTGLFMIFSMFSSMFQTILNKKLSGQQLAWFLPLAFVFSFCSSIIVNHYVKRTGRQSTVILIVMVVTALGFGCVIYNLINGLVTDSSIQTTFTSVC